MLPSCIVEMRNVSGLLMRTLKLREAKCLAQSHTTVVSETGSGLEWHDLDPML